MRHVFDVRQGSLWWNDPNEADVLEQLWQATELLRELASEPLDLTSAAECAAVMKLAEQAENIGHSIKIGAMTEIGRILKTGRVEAG